MRLLLDECVPRPLKRDLAGHEVAHVRDLGWSGKRNGEILRLMVGAGFDTFLTVDQKLPFQQNVSAQGIAVVVLAAKTNRRKELLPLVPAVLVALQTLQRGQLIRVGA